jgi:hypothetical protein
MLHYAGALSLRARGRAHRVRTGLKVPESNVVWASSLRTGYVVSLDFRLSRPFGVQNENHSETAKYHG